MKKLGKLSINSEKVIKNEELVNLRGGSGSYVCVCCSIGNVGGNMSSGECDALGWFQAPYDNCDDGFDYAHEICGDYNNNCNTSMTCGTLIV